MAKKVLSRLNRIVWLVVKPYLIMNGLLACSLSLLSLSFSSFLYLSLCRLIRKCAGRQAGRQRDKIKIGIAPNASHMAQTLHVSVIHHGVENIAKLFSNSSTVTLARLFSLFYLYFIGYFYFCFYGCSLLLIWLNLFLVFWWWCWNKRNY